MRRLLSYLILLLTCPLFLQLANAQLEYRSIFGIQKSVLDPGNPYFDFTGDMVNHLKIYDQTKKTYVVKPSTTVYNDVALTSFVGYGLTRNLTLFGWIPLRSVHLYSLDPTLTGKGFGDLQLGGTLNFIHNEKSVEMDATLSTTLPIASDTPPSKGQYPLGINAIQFTASVDGYNPVGKYGLCYSVYYNLVGNDGSFNYGDWTGAYLMFDKYDETQGAPLDSTAGINAAYKFRRQNFRESSEQLLRLLPKCPCWHNILLQPKPRLQSWSAIHDLSEERLVHQLFGADWRAIPTWSLNSCS
jgi:hypothetical protein